MIVDPAGGTLRDENAFGRHQEMIEKTEVQTQVAFKNLSTWKKLTCNVMPVIRAVTVAFSVHGIGLPFNPAGMVGLGLASKAATNAAVDAAPQGLDQPVVGGPPTP